VKLLNEALEGLVKEDDLILSMGKLRLKGEGVHVPGFI
jgi:hypothetical protein